MGSKWRKAKVALGMNLCLYVPKTEDDSSSSSTSSLADERLSDAALLSPARGLNAPTRSPHGPKLAKSLCKSSKTCSICLKKMKQGGGHAIFTGECSHSFHFHCIASNVKHGNQICPVCRAKWTEIPFQGPTPVPSPARFHRLPPPPHRRQAVPLFPGPEPAIFDDDESLLDSCDKDVADITTIPSRTVEIKTYPEVSAAPRANSYDDFTVLVHMKAASVVNHRVGVVPKLGQMTSRCAPVDLVTVLDISGSMAGTKLALLKRAMGFVIQNLRSNDRLSVIAFSSTARRLFPLRRMTDSGRQHALQAVNSLVANGGTNIAEGLRKGAKVMADRRGKNPVASIILLSDGQDTYTVNGNGNSAGNYRLLLPVSIGGENAGFQIPVHTFGFGADHDASSMHSISEISGGTFSFIETESVIQDAFAQCIGGLLSVVAQELKLTVECSSPGVLIRSVKAGSYPSRVAADKRTGGIDVGDMYADEERDFLVSVQFPAESSGDSTSLLKVKCGYRDPMTKETTVLKGEEVRVQRPETVVAAAVSIEVDRQRNRLRAAAAMAEARDSAEHGELAGAAAVLERCRREIGESAAAKRRDTLWVALDAELREMEERMGSRQVYEASGRAYMLSGLSSHSWQRATARGDSTDGASLLRAYQTPSMAHMLSRSHGPFGPLPKPR